MSALLIRDISNESGEYLSMIRDHLSERDLCWKLLTVSPHGSHLGSLPVQMPRAGFQISFETGLMEFAHDSRHENRERFADKLFRVVSKYSLGCGVRENDYAALVDTDHRVAGRFNHNSVSCFASLELVLAPLPVVYVGQ